MQNYIQNVVSLSLSVIALSARCPYCIVAILRGRVVPYNAKLKLFQAGLDTRTQNYNQTNSSNTAGFPARKQHSSNTGAGTGCKH